MSLARTTVLSLLAAACAVSAASCARPEPYTAETFVMGTAAWVTVAGAGAAEAEEAAQEVFREFRRIESVMSAWADSSELSLLNAGAGSGPVAVSPELFALVDSSLRYSRGTFGAFDPTVRPLVLLWGFQGGEPALPSPGAIDSALALVGCDGISLDDEALAVSLPAGAQIDFAGIAKGYAVDRGAAILERRGIRRALVNLGGNIYALGSPPGGRGWRIGVRDPRGGLGTVGTILLADAAVATSGNYENFVEIDGRRYGHIIDPRTGRTVDGVLSVTVAAPTALAADALSTGFFVLGPVEAARALSSFEGVAALFALPNGVRIEYKVLGEFGRRLVLDPETAGRR
jgi:thiamine biosynthesis lipoprotein